MSTFPAPLAVVQKVYAALGKGDVPGLLMLAASDSVWTVHAPKHHPYGGVFRGQGGLGMFLGQLTRSAQLLELAPTEFHVAGDQVFVVGRQRLRWKPAGGEFTTSWVQRWRVKDGKIAVFEEWTDTATALAARLYVAGRASVTWPARQASRCLVVVRASPVQRAVRDVAESRSLTWARVHYAAPRALAPRPQPHRPPAPGQRAHLPADLAARARGRRLAGAAR